MKAFPNPHRTDETGMTLRDYFAAKAMQAFLTRETKFSENLMMYAGAAYDVADAMLKAREL
jgi:hypothetical protein